MASVKPGIGRFIDLKGLLAEYGFAASNYVELDRLVQVMGHRDTRGIDLVRVEQVPVSIGAELDRSVTLKPIPSYGIEVANTDDPRLKVGGFGPASS